MQDKLFRDLACRKIILTPSGIEPATPRPMSGHDPTEPEVRDDIKCKIVYVKRSFLSAIAVLEMTSFSRLSGSRTVSPHLHTG